MNPRNETMKSTKLQASGKKPLKVLVIDVGGTHVKIVATDRDEEREFASGPE